MNRIQQRILEWDSDKLAECVVTPAVIAGFTDADGCLSENRGAPMVQLAQSHNYGRDTLTLLQHYIGGTLVGPYKHDDYQLRLYGSAALKVIGYGEKHGVIKPYINLENISDQWLGGFFAGDGCIYRRKDCNGFTVQITQWSQPDVLYAIENYLGYGKANDKTWSCGGGMAREFAATYHPFALFKFHELLDAI